jgi:hypothetical protein
MALKLLGSLESSGGNVGIGTTSPTTTLDVNGVITATSGNSTNWNTAYGWGNHGSVGYATQTWVGEQNYASDAAISTAIATVTLASLGYTGASNANYITNNNQLTNGAGYITSSGSITGNAATATSAGKLSGNSNISTQPGTNNLLHTGQISNGVTGLFPAVDNSNSIITLNRHSGNYDSQLGFSSNGNIYYRKFSNSAAFTTQAWLQVWHSGNFANNSTNWNTAYGWGNHASAGYLTTSSAASTYAPKASPALTGTPTAPTAAAATNTTQIATTAFVQTAVSNLVDSAPGALNTLNELAAALGDDASFSTTVTNSIATKLSLAGGTLTGDLRVTNGDNNGIRFHSDGANITSVASGDVVIQRLTAGLRFGSSAGWDYNEWAGVKFDSVNEVLYIGGPAATQFSSNANPPTIDVNFVGVGAIKVGGSNTITDTKIGQWGTAYGWGNHASAGYLTTTGKAADSNLLDGIDSGSFLRSDAADTATGEILFDAGFKSDPIMLSGSQNFDNISRSGFYNLYGTNSGSTNSPGFDYGTMIVVGNNKQSSGFGFQLAHERLNSAGKFRVRGMNDSASAWSSWATVWTSLDFANNSANWNTAYTDRNKWDGGSTGLNAATGRTSLGLGTLATLSTVNAATITDNSVGAAELNVTGNGSNGQVLTSDGDGTFSWTAKTTNTDTITSVGLSGSETAGTVTLTGAGATTLTQVGGTIEIRSTDTNTTYTVGDGGLTQKNFTTTLQTKLDGIEAGANVTDTANVVAALTAGTNVSIAANGTISATDTNTTYSAGTGLALSGTTFKLKGGEIPGSADLNHSSYRATGVYSQNSNSDATSGSNYPVALAGMLEVWNDDYGNGLHCLQRYSQYNSTDVYQRNYYNGNWSAWRNLTQDTNTTYSVGDNGLTQKNFTATLNTKLDGIAASANNYSLPAGTSLVRGGFKIGYTENGKNYPVEVSSEKMYVNVPWTDTNTDTITSVGVSGSETNGTITLTGAGATTITQSGGAIEIRSTDTNTTYSVGDNGLTEKNFTGTLKTKLDGIASSANNYSLPESLLLPLPIAILRTLTLLLLWLD